MFQKIKAFLSKWNIENGYDEHQKRMKEIESQHKKIMQEIIELEKSIEETQSKVIEIFLIDRTTTTSGQKKS